MLLNACVATTATTEQGYVCRRQGRVSIDTSNLHVEHASVPPQAPSISMSFSIACMHASFSVTRVAVSEGVGRLPISGRIVKRKDQRSNKQ